MLCILCIATATAQDHLVPFRDATQQRWGYRRADGSVAIQPQFVGAGEFHDGQAPVKDANGFATIDDRGRILLRIAVDAVTRPDSPLPPPDRMCAPDPARDRFPSTGLQCYMHQLQGSSPVVGGRVTISPRGGGESGRSAVIAKLSTGVVLVEDIGYEGFIRRVLLPGVSGDEARQWRLMLFPDAPEKAGCSEAWHSGVIPGGAFIEQRAGC